jgi:hypothetical protein
MLLGFSISSTTIRRGRFLERFAPTAGDHYLIACLEKRFRQSASDTRAPASNEDGVAIDVHVFSSFALKVTKCKSHLCQLFGIEFCSIFGTSPFNNARYSRIMLLAEREDTCV